ncbi:19536_t:CDS:2, partial [Racocetra fulgida]
MDYINKIIEFKYENKIEIKNDKINNNDEENDDSSDEETLSKLFKDISKKKIDIEDVNANKEDNCKKLVGEDSNNNK